MMADILEIDPVDDDVGYEYDTTKIPDIIAPDEMMESGYQEGSEQSYGDRRDSKEGFGGEGDSDSGVDGVSSGCSVADDCPVVSINDVVAYYDDIRPRRRHVPQLSFYNVDIERLAMDALIQVLLRVNSSHALGQQLPNLKVSLRISQKHLTLLNKMYGKIQI
ncbi:uncharacterized protein LOC113500707 isoform X1 [Trichoplusia ni]|uniref:Uncharacterized protein LOC113500707 isoform X1 n=1 Tax=Trichoplusia ni TaxID=7111 RepID=A0A7E5W9R7_TRINI|nr:uncharacterized protein LOC113500707 isoform X1 [Trichoplusia ni]XP_026737386.1 uncharacterized protein LOC113500707 isoform X1 [Trichoplusia ni]XP_026737387.1 uncharacterized protein LOC113500707 isoform X1 [Trichoplusia ni]